ncbi:hypothetical protein ASPTUDRAFT_46247 [Aspergillus tubingensis CBS 134.48]|uniref:Uncharacterized protein n=1 Tax=Aspergillus tubingensis (strain CBS 134.48) TaxID=767770 RepID=A0A1L9MVB7_ASPTC|nr:hypothetical protein ASPTUDRAFT_46247 [Aspergillus tubingensis CBS 134.48]
MKPNHHHHPIPSPFPQALSPQHLPRYMIQNSKEGTVDQKPITTTTEYYHHAHSPIHPFAYPTHT